MNIDIGLWIFLGITKLAVIIFMLVYGPILSFHIGSKSIFEQYMTKEGLNEKKAFKHYGNCIIAFALIRFVIAAIHFFDEEVLSIGCEILSYIFFFISVLLGGLYISKIKPARLITYHRVAVYMDLHQSIDIARRIYLNHTILCANGEYMNRVDCSYITFNKKIHNTYNVTSSDGYDYDVDSYIIYGTGSSSYTAFVVLYSISIFVFAIEAIAGIFLLIEIIS